jgi:hypothetical protein
MFKPKCTPLRMFKKSEKWTSVKLKSSISSK